MNLGEPFDEKSGADVRKKPIGTNRLIAIFRGILGAIAGGAIGHFAFAWMAWQGFYAIVLPGALLGLGFGLAARYPSMVYGVFCGVAGLALGIVSEWLVRPWLKDGSFEYFLTHLQDLNPVTIIMILFGGLMAFWFGRGR